MFQRIGIIGTGNMGGAVVKAIASGKYSGELLLANRTPGKAAALCDTIGKGSVATSEEIAKSCDLIIFGVKPQNIKEVAEELAPVLSTRKERVVLVSMLAGYSVSDLRALFHNLPVMHIMPNTPVAVGSGVILYYQDGLTDAEEKEIVSLLEPAGLVEKTDESIIGIAGTLTGCGPAIAYVFIEALADGAVAGGVPREKAIRYAARMIEGSAEMVLQSGMHPEALKDAVCSPGGTSIQAIRTLEDRGFRSAAFEAVLAAYEAKKKLK